MLDKRRLSGKYPDIDSNFLEAEKYWNSQLLGETTINIPQDKDCQISVVVPVHNEDLSVILRQLQSIAAQEDINPNIFELFYVVNNSPEASPEIVAKNAEVLQLTIWKNRETISNDNSYSPNVRKLLSMLRGFNLFVIEK